MARRFLPSQSSLLSRVLREKRRLLVPLAIVAVANLAALALVVYPLSRRVAAAEQRASDVGLRLARATNEYRAARATLESRQRTDEQLGRFYADVLPRNYTAARHLTYLKLVQLAREANLTYDSRTFRLEEADRRTARNPKEPKSTLERLDIVFPLEGEYRDVRQFIHTLETSPEFIVIRDVSLLKASDTRSPLSLNLQLATYYRADDAR